MKINFDDWQQEILDYDGDILLCKGRRIGGTEIFAIKAAKEMIKHPKIKIVMVSLTEDQAQLIINVAHEYLELEYKKFIAKGKNKPTLNRIILTNGASMIVRPLGTTGNAIRSFDGDILGIDEAPWQDKKIWRAARPIIATNNGRIWMWGTPAAKEGYFWEQYNKIYNQHKEGRFKVWHKNSEEVLFNRPICESWTQEQHDGVIRILAEEKESMSELEYGNEFLGEFLEELTRLYNDEWINKVCSIKRDGIIRGKTYLGIDVAGMGKDKNSFEEVDKIDKDHIRQIENITTAKQYTHEVVNKALELQNHFHNKKIGVDDAGVGFGVFSGLLFNNKTKDKVVGLNNARRPLDSDDKAKKRLLKEDMHINLLTLGEKGQIKLLDDLDVKKSLATVQIEEKDGRTFIFGRDTHIAEGIIRAAWLASQDKSLNLWAC